MDAFVTDPRIGKSFAELHDAPIRGMDAANYPAVRALLDDMQANILKGHGRHHAAHMFLSFEGMDADAICTVLRTLGQHCTSAYGQLRRNRKYPPHLDGGIVRVLALSASGYAKIDKFAAMPDGGAFQAGMAARKTLLGDPDRPAWDKTGWREQRPDALFLIADASPDAVTADLEAVEGWLNGTGVTITVIERALQQTRNFRKGVAEGVEHFGYVDGRSQPLFLQEDIDAENIPNDPPGTKGSAKQHWSPVFKPSQFVVADPNATTDLAAGSYFVFRKLEQNIRGFNAAEDALGRAYFGPGATQEQRDRAGAMVVGRFEDGTPLTLSCTAKAQPVTNDFTYAGDRDAKHCPFHAHIRKVNPRGDIERITNTEDEAPGRQPIMARRGITYGPLRPHNADGSEFDDAGSEPVNGSGLLFMAYMASIENQFEFTQQSWANNAQFVANIAGGTRPETGIDPIIGQPAGNAGRSHTYEDACTGGPPKVLTFDQFVTMMGGEYFFTPSLGFLRSVGL